jgi:alpha-galactosidase
MKTYNKPIMIACKKSILVVLLLMGMNRLSAQMNFVANTRTPLSEPTQLMNNTEKAITAPRPPMGWNSWDNFGLDISEKEFRAQVDYVATHLKQYGYEYMVIDAGWYAPDLSADVTSPRYEGNLTKFETNVDAFGRWIPAANKFPSAKNGSFRALADYVHSKGLKFGLHIQRGIPWSAIDRNLPIKGTPYHAKDIANPADVCAWWDATLGVDMSKPGAQEYYNSCYELYASWGVDFVKVDDISRPYHADEIAAIRLAIEKTKRKMVFSLSPGTTPITVRYHVENNADMWRISDDFWDTWPQLKNQFHLAAEWMRFHKEGHWPDLDMLPVGIIGTRSGDAGGQRRSRFSQDELHTLMTLWCMFRSPLILGGDLTQLSAAETELITNPALLRIDQTSHGCKQVWNDGKTVIYTAEDADGSTRYAAFFNLDEAKRTITYNPDQMGASNYTHIHELWSGTEGTTLQADVNPHGAALFILKK